MKVALEVRRRAEEESRKALGGRNSGATRAACKSLHGQQTDHSRDRTGSQKGARQETWMDLYRTFLKSKEKPLRCMPSRKVFISKRSPTCQVEQPSLNTGLYILKSKNVLCNFMCCIFVYSYILYSLCTLSNKQIQKFLKGTKKQFSKSCLGKMLIIIEAEQQVHGVSLLFFFQCMLENEHKDFLENYDDGYVLSLINISEHNVYLG